MSVEKKVEELSIGENPAASIANESAPATTATNSNNVEGEEVVLGEDGQPLSKKALKKLLKEKEKAAKKAEREAQLAKEKAAREAEAANDPAKENYGKLPLINSSTRNADEKRILFKDLSVANDGETVTFRARVHKTRQQGATMVFLTLRQQSELIQALLKTNKDTDATAVSKQMVKWTGSINLESIL